MFFFGNDEKLKDDGLILIEGRAEVKPLRGVPIISERGKELRD
jgi:hypothetical protein